MITAKIEVIYSIRDSSNLNNVKYAKPGKRKPKTYTRRKYSDGGLLTGSYLK